MVIFFPFTYSRFSSLELLTASEKFSACFFNQLQVKRNIWNLSVLFSRKILEKSLKIKWNNIMNLLKRLFATALGNFKRPKPLKCKLLSKFRERKLFVWLRFLFSVCENKTTTFYILGHCCCIQNCFWHRSVVEWLTKHFSFNLKKFYSK